MAEDMDQMAVWCVGIDCDGNDNLHRWQTPRPIQAQYVNVYTLPSGNLT